MPDAKVVKPIKDPKRGCWISPAGVELVSVTQAIKAAGMMSYKGSPVNNPHVDRGTDVHEGIERLLKGNDDLAVQDASLPYISSFVNFLEHTKPEIIECERRMWDDDYGVCGQVDLVAQIGNETAIVDYKTGSPAAWHGVQTAGYKFLRFPEDPGVARYCLYLNKTGKMPKLVRHDDERDLAVFLGAVAVVQWKRRKGVKGWLMEK